MSMPGRSPWSTLHHSVEGVGTSFPAHQTMAPGYDYAAPDSIRRIPPDDFPDFEPNFAYAILEDRAIPADLVSSAPFSGVGFLISDRFYELLGRFDLPPHRLFRCPVLHRDLELSNYGYLHVPHPPIEIDASASAAHAEQQVLADPALSSVDLLNLRRPSRFAYTFVTAPLRAAIEQAGLTGIRFGTSRLFRV